MNFLRFTPPPQASDEKAVDARAEAERAHQAALEAAELKKKEMEEVGGG